MTLRSKTTVTGLPLVDLFSGQNPSITPDTDVDTPLPSNSDTTPTFHFSGTPGVSPINYLQYRLNNGEWVTSTSPVTLSTLQDGKYYFQARAVDTAGIADETLATYEWVLTSRLVASIDSPPTGNLDISDSPQFPTEIVLSYTDPGNQNDFDHFEFSFSTTTPRVWVAVPDGVSIFSISGIPVGTTSFFVRAVDINGNVSDVDASVVWTVNIVPPPEIWLGSTTSFEHTFQNEFFSTAHLNAVGMPGSTIRTITDLSGLGFTLVSGSNIVFNGPTDFVRYNTGESTFAVVNTSTPAVSVESRKWAFTNSTQTVKSGVIARYVDANNYIFGGYDSGTLKISAYIIGIENILESVVFTPPNNTFYGMGLYDNGYFLELHFYHHPQFTGSGAVLTVISTNTTFQNTATKSGTHFVAGTSPTAFPDIFAWGITSLVPSLGTTHPLRDVFNFRVRI
jgi:hypothetical protein